MAAPETRVVTVLNSDGEWETRVWDGKKWVPAPPFGVDPDQ